MAKSLAQDSQYRGLDLHSRPAEYAVESVTRLRHSVDRKYIRSVSVLYWRYKCAFRRRLIVHFEYLSLLLLQRVPLATEPGISLIILTPMKILQRNLNRSSSVVWEMKGNVCVVRLILAVWDVLAAHSWSHLLRCNHHNSCIYGNLQHLCKSIGR